MPKLSAALAPPSHPRFYLITLPTNDHPPTDERPAMSKGMDQKKSEKKAPTKTLKEKRAEKQEKKKNK
jgi:hypothetical protein